MRRLRPTPVACGSLRAATYGRPLALPLVLGLTLVLSAAAPMPRAAAQGDVPLADVLQIVVRDKELIAFDAEGGGQTTQSLQLGEQVLWWGSRGRVGVVITGRRILAVATGSAAWQEERLKRVEAPPARALLGERVALILTEKRALGFDGGSGNLVESSLGPRERVVRTAVGSNAAVVVTGRRVLGLSPFRGGFFEASLRISEDIESVDALANLVTVTTSNRLLVFRAPTGTWEERNLDLR